MTTKISPGMLVMYGADRTLALVSYTERMEGCVRIVRQVYPDYAWVDWIPCL